MKKRVITIEFATDAGPAVLEEIAYLMQVQLESLNDNTLDMGTQQCEDIVNEEYALLSVKVD